MRAFFFFQAEDGIRDYKVTGVQTCALPIFRPNVETHPRFRIVVVPRSEPAVRQPSAGDDAPIAFEDLVTFGRKIPGEIRIEVETILIGIYEQRRGTLVVAGVPFRTEAEPVGPPTAVGIQRAIATDLEAARNGVV